jgi:nucleoside-diphosphate-sugar epimerase
LRFSEEVRNRLDRSGLEFVVTGGGGWIGRATLEMLGECLGGQTRARVHVFGRSARPVGVGPGLTLSARPLDELPSLVVGPHLLVHLAYSTREQIPAQGLVPYITGNRAITTLVADHLTRSTPVGFFSPSSGAVYLGDDLDSNPYGVLKLEDERRFSELVGPSSGSATECRVVVPRLFNLAGPFLNKPEVYALGSILGAIRGGGPVRLTSDRPVVRSYLHVADLVDLAFAVMVGGGPVPDRPFDTAGERDIEIGELAELAVSLVGGPEITVERPPLVGTGTDRYVGDGSTLRELARAYGLELRPLPVQIVDTARYLGV